MRIALSAVVALALVSCASLTTGDVPRLVAECEASNGRLDWRVVDSWGNWLGEDAVEVACNPSDEAPAAILGETP